MQKRIHEVEWSGKSNLPQITSVKEPKYYLTVIDAKEQYEEEVYFVNNSDAVLPLVIADWCTDEQYHAIYKRVINQEANQKINHETDQKADQKADQKVISSLAKTMDINPEFIYQNVRPYQGVKIATQHMMYSSDGLNQCRISVFANTDIVNKFWKFSVVESGLFTGGVLLWKDDSVPKSIIARQFAV